jgi:hypothetical protein
MCDKNEAFSQQFCSGPNTRKTQPYDGIPLFSCPRANSKPVPPASWLPNPCQLILTTVGLILVPLSDAAAAGAADEGNTMKEGEIMHDEPIEHLRRGCLTYIFRGIILDGSRFGVLRCCMKRYRLQMRMIHQSCSCLARKDHQETSMNWFNWM